MPQHRGRRPLSYWTQRAWQVTRRDGLAVASLKTIEVLQSRARRTRLSRRVSSWLDPIITARRRRAEEFRLMNPLQRARMGARLKREPQTWRVSVVMPTWNRCDVLGTAIRSVLDQVYENFELIVVDDGSTDHTFEVVERLRLEDPRIRYLRVEHAGVSAARNAGLAVANGTYLAYLDSDNVWDDDYLLFMVHYLVSAGADSAYCALEARNTTQPPAELVRRQRFDLERLLKNNYIDLNCFMHSRTILERLGGFDESLRRWVDWDLILRYVRHRPPVTVPVLMVRYLHLDRLDQITLRESDAFRLKVLNKHLIDWSALERDLDSRDQRVSIVIPVYKGLEMTRDCVESIFRHGSRRDFEVIIVDNGSPRSDREGLHKLAESYPDRIRVLQCRENFGYGLGNNLGVAESKGRDIVLLNNDTVVHEGWLDELINALHEPGVGAVQPKLLYPDGTIQAAGLSFSEYSKIPYHIYRGDEGDAPHVNRRRDFSALTGACLAIRARDYVRLRGFDPLFRNGCEDLDLCFRMRRELSKRMLYLPTSTVTHYESKTEGRRKHISENRKLFVERWGSDVEPDDRKFYQEDGFVIGPYVKQGRTPHADWAVYMPAFLRKTATPHPNPVVRKLKVGFVAVWHLRGITIHALQLIRSLEAKGDFEVEVFARWQADAFDNSGPVHHPRVVDAKDDPSPEEMLDWVRDRNVDAVVFMEVHPNDWKRIAALKRAGILVAAYENLDLLRMGLVDRYGELDMILANTFYGHERMGELVPGVPRVLVPWGIPDPKPASAPKLIEGGGVSYVHVAGWGGLNNRKNTDLVIRTFAEARLARSRLRLHTQKPLSEYGPDIERMAEQDPRIQVISRSVDSVMAAYRKADVVLCPSKREGLGLPIVEALASGRPVITSDGYMMKQWLVRDIHGWLCPGTAQEDQMALPEIMVDESSLGELMERIDADPSDVQVKAKAIRADSEVWTWREQADLLRQELRRFIEYPGYMPEPGLDHLPVRLSRFEARRLAAELEHSVSSGASRERVEEKLTRSLADHRPIKP